MQSRIQTLPEDRLPGATPLCSVCIANYNGIDMLKDCIESIQLQDAEFGIEIIVHDDASTDGSVAFIKKHYPDVTLIESDTNVGFCVSNNRMTEVARGEYLLLLNNDASLFPDALRTLAAAAAAEQRPAILSLPQYSAYTGALIDIGSRVDLFLNPISNLDPSNDRFAMVSGACFWLPRTLWQKLGGFPEWFGSVGEDLLLCCVARLWGYSVKAIPASGFRHRVGTTLGGGRIDQKNRLSATVRRRRLTERNKTFVMAVVYPGPTFLLLAFHALALASEGIALALVKRKPLIFRDIYLFALKAQWTERESLCRLRKQIQLERKIGIMEFFKPVSWFPHKLRLLFRHGLPAVSE